MQSHSQTNGYPVNLYLINKVVESKVELPNEEQNYFSYLQVS